MTTTPAHRPPMDPDTDEADARQLDAARAEGESYGRSVELMVGSVAEGGGCVPAGDYQVGYAVEEAEGMYVWRDGGLVWTEPEEENLHVEVVVRDGADGRFVPELEVYATLIDPDGNEVGTHQQPFLWHPMLYHYGRNWKVPGDGTYTLRVRIDPPQFMRHDKVNGKRYTVVARAEFTGVEVKPGRG